MKSILLSMLFIATISLGHNSLANSTFSPDDAEKIAQNYTWTEYTTFGGIKIEYKFSECNSVNVKNQVLVLFRFSNLTTSKKSLSWTLKTYRDGDCSNCARLDNPEYSHELVLEPNQVVEGTCDSKANKALYVFGNFINLSPGMSETYLTNFKFINLNTTVVQ